jgi:hypothetical protein
MCDQTYLKHPFSAFKKLDGLVLSVGGIKFKLQPSLSMNAFEDYVATASMFDHLITVVHVEVPVRAVESSRLGSKNSIDNTFGPCYVKQITVVEFTPDGRFIDSITRQVLDLNDLEKTRKTLTDTLEQRGCVADSLAEFVLSCLDHALTEPASFSMSAPSSALATQVGVTRKCYHINGLAPYEAVNDVRLSGIAVERIGECLKFKSFNCPVNPNRQEVVRYADVNQHDYVPAHLSFNFISLLREAQLMRLSNWQLVLDNVKHQYEQLLKMSGASELHYA